MFSYFLKCVTIIPLRKWFHFDWAFSITNYSHVHQCLHMCFKMLVEGVWKIIGSLVSRRYMEPSYIERMQNAP